MGKKEEKPKPAESVPTAVDPPKEEQKTAEPAEKKEEVAEKKEEERGRKEWPSTRPPAERSVSPGTMPGEYLHLCIGAGGEIDGG